MRSFLLFVLVAFGLCVEAQIDAPKFLIDLEFGYNRTIKENDADGSQAGIYFASDYQRYLRLGEKLGLSVGAGVYVQIFSYQDKTRLSFGCDLPVSFGGPGQQTFTRSTVAHSGLMVPLKLHYIFDKESRWIAALGARAQFPIISSIDRTIFECGNPPGLEVDDIDAFGGLRTVIPRFDFSVGYSVPAARKGYFVQFGLFAGWSPTAHLEEGLLNTSAGNFDVGVRFSVWRGRG